MDAATTLINVQFVLFSSAILWVLVIAWRINKLWPLSFLFLVPLPVFIFRHRRVVKWPMILALLSIATGLAALVVGGDLFDDQHPDELNRSWIQRTFGCSGSNLWKQWAEASRQEPEQWIADYAFETGPINSESGAAKVSVLAAALAYLPKEFSRQQAVKWGFSEANIKPIEGKTDYALVMASEAVVIVAFRGTDDRYDWASNVDFLPGSSQWGRVHRGFLRGLDELWPEVDVAVKKLRNKNQSLWLTGHSRGGALAVLAAANFESQGIDVAGVVTFGQPPVGGAKFKQQFEESMSKSSVLRFVNHTDIVAETISPIAFWNLEHVGELRYFDTAGRLHAGKPTVLQLQRDAVCAQSFEAGAELRAHKIRRYVGLLAQSLPAGRM